VSGTPGCRVPAGAWRRAVRATSLVGVRCLEVPAPLLPAARWLSAPCTRYVILPVVANGQATAPAARHARGRLVGCRTSQCTRITAIRRSVSSSPGLGHIGLAAWQRKEFLCLPFTHRVAPRPIGFGTWMLTAFGCVAVPVSVRVSAVVSGLTPAPERTPAATQQTCLTRLSAAVRLPRQTLV
jgi:hypothetical protein